MQQEVIQKIESKQCSKSLLKKGGREAADLRAELKSHNKIVIQSKHLRSADSTAAVDGCEPIMNVDGPNAATSDAFVQVIYSLSKSCKNIFF